MDTRILFDKQFTELVSGCKWYVSRERGNQYAVANTRKNGMATTIKMHRLILGLPKFKPEVDHINHNGLDNRLSNLRVVTTSQNQGNRKKRKTARNTSAFKGVHKHSFSKLNPKMRNPWISKIFKDGKHYKVGSFGTEREAALAYNKKATELFGEYAYLNKVAS